MNTVHRCMKAQASISVSLNFTYPLVSLSLSGISDISSFAAIGAKPQPGVHLLAAQDRPQYGLH